MENFHVQFPNLGWEFDISRVAISLGSFKVYWYGLIRRDLCSRFSTPTRQLRVFSSISTS